MYKARFSKGLLNDSDCNIVCRRSLTQSAWITCCFGWTTCLNNSSWRLFRNFNYFSKRKVLISEYFSRRKTFPKVSKLMKRQPTYEPIINCYRFIDGRTSKFQSLRTTRMIIMTINHFRTTEPFFICRYCLLSMGTTKLYVQITLEICVRDHHV